MLLGISWHPPIPIIHRNKIRLSRYHSEEALRLLFGEAELDAQQGYVADYIPELRLP